MFSDSSTRTMLAVAVVATPVVALPLAAYYLSCRKKNYVRNYVPPDPRSFGKYPRGSKMFVTTPDAEMEIHYSEIGVASERNSSIIKYLDEVVEKKGNMVALRVERAVDGAPAPASPTAAAGGKPAPVQRQWKSWTWAEYQADAYRFAKSLLALGMKQHQAVSIIGFNSPEWLISFLGAIAAGGKGVGVYTTNGPDACQYVVEHSESIVVVVEDRKQLEKMIQVKGRLPLVKAIVVYAESPPANASTESWCPVYDWNTFLKLGSRISTGDVKARVDATRAGHCCSLIYTSGTTGNPKGVMISHDNLLFMVRSALQIIDFLATTEDERGVSYLPLSHVAGQMLDIVMPIIASCVLPRNVTISFARPDALKGSLVKTLQAVRPTFFLGVPRVFEKMVEGMKEKAKETKGLKKKIAIAAKACGLIAAEAIQVGGSGVLPFSHTLYDRLVFQNVKKALGFDKVKYAFSGAAPIRRETLAFLGSLGIQVHEAYGLSECTSGTTFSVPYCYKWGSVGRVLPGCELKIDHQPSRDKPGEGEVIFRGRHLMMGYLKEEQKTKDCIDADGWFHSGDLGRLDEQGLLYITGRIKELIITAGGENVAPIPIEDEFKRLMPAISASMVVGDKRKFLIVLITLDTKPDMATGTFTSQLKAEALNVSPGVTTVEQAQKDPAWAAYINKNIKTYNTGEVCVSNAAKVQKFAILPTDFSIPGGELTATMKLKRKFVEEKYKALIESVYGPDD